MSAARRKGIQAVGGTRGRELPDNAPALSMHNDYEYRLCEPTDEKSAVYNKTYDTVVSIVNGKHPKKNGSEI